MNKKQIEKLEAEIERLHKQVIEEITPREPRVAIRGQVLPVVDAKRVGNTSKGQKPFWIFVVQNDVQPKA